jgi:hypothetical protein
VNNCLVLLSNDRICLSITARVEVAFGRSAWSSLRQQGETMQR